MIRQPADNEDEHNHHHHFDNLKLENILREFLYFTSNIYTEVRARERVLLTISHLPLGLNALSLGLRSLSNGPTSPELEAHPAVGVAHDGDGEEVGEDHEGDVVPRSISFYLGLHI